MLGKGIALASIQKNKIPEDGSYFVQIRNNIYKAHRQKNFIKGGKQ